MGHLSISNAVAVGAAALLLAVGWCSQASAEQAQGGVSEGRRGPVYQRHAFESSAMRGGWQGSNRGHNHFSPPIAPQINAGWFQRPYPYHLDYYKMRYGGSYAPYFGNLYGPPQVVTAPPYYGPYYGGYGGYGVGYPAMEQGSNGVAE